MSYNKWLLQLTEWSLCGWLYDALLVNGVPHEKLVLSRHGVGDATKPSLGETERLRPTTVWISRTMGPGQRRAYLGRGIQARASEV